ncbi:LysR family transcriptional regulator [Paenibacillus sp. FSL R10-2791]|uniref:LysR family transcriptional regulator n=1 Tax=Paenibacillus sp. FSL R10-2791 TaxID=2954695 RepID=UPI0030FB375F
MNITQLQYLISAANYGTFTKAASVHHLTVPTISQSVRQLEDELDTVIFHRTKKGITPTKEGQLILQHSVSILKSVEIMKRELSLLKEESSENIIISTIPGMVPQVVQTTIEFAKRYPLLNVQMLEGDTETVQSHLNEGYASMGLVTYSSEQQKDASFDWMPLIEGKAVLIVNKNSPLRFLNSVTADNLRDEVFVLYKDEFIESIAHGLISAHPTNRIALSTNNMDALYQMVVKGDTITIGPDFIIHSFPSSYQKQLVTIPLKQYNSEPVVLGRITRKQEQATKMVEEFTSRLTELFMGTQNSLETDDK